MQDPEAQFPLIAPTLPEHCYCLAQQQCRMAPASKVTQTALLKYNKKYNKLAKTGAYTRARRRCQCLVNVSAQPANSGSNSSSAEYYKAKRRPDAVVAVADQRTTIRRLRLLLKRLHPDIAHCA
jgi:hypothetical protein